MSGEFFDTFNGSLEDFEQSFGESFEVNGRSLQAIAINTSDITNKVMRGGQLQDVKAEIYVREDVFQRSGITSGTLITTRGQQFAVLTIAQDGDDSRTILCGSAQVDVWK